MGNMDSVKILYTAHSLTGERHGVFYAGRFFKKGLLLLPAGIIFAHGPLLHYTTDSEGSLDYTDIRKGNIKNQLIEKIQSI